MNGLDAGIAEHPFLCSMSERDQAVLLECASRKTFAPGEILFREGEPADRFYLIESGKIALEAVLPSHGTVRVETLGPDDVLGWSWLFEPFTWEFQARAIDAGSAISFNAAHLLRLSHEDRRLGCVLMNKMARLAARTLHAAHQRLVETSMEKAASNAS